MAGDGVHLGMVGGCVLTNRLVQQEEIALRHGHLSRANNTFQGANTHYRVQTHGANTHYGVKTHYGTQKYITGYKHTLRDANTQGANHTS